MTTNGPRSLQDAVLGADEVSECCTVNILCSFAVYASRCKYISSAHHVSCAEVIAKYSGKIKKW
jgi:hypothetical protein